jgi:Aspartyl protease
MTFLRIMILLSGYFLTGYQGLSGTVGPGFSLPDSLDEFTLTYRPVDGLIVLPFTINGTIEVNLILDTGCRNVILFGKRFENLLSFIPDHTIEFSGMGSGEPVRGEVSLENSISSGAIKGERIPIILVPQKKFFKTYMNVDGLIGYEIFTRFEIELNPSGHQITFRSALTHSIPEGYKMIPLRIVDSKPMINAAITMTDEILLSDLLIDTGSAAGLLLKSSEEPRLAQQESILGKGLNGMIKGVNTTANRLFMDSFFINDIPVGIIYASRDNSASLGMDVLKDYAIIINYVQSYLCIKSNIDVENDAYF